MKVPALMNQLLDDEGVTPDITPSQSAPNKRGWPRKTMAQTSDQLTAEAKEEDVKPKTVDPRNALNELTSTEWLPETVSVWNQRGLGANHPDAQIERQHPAPFSFTDVSRLVRFFTKRNEVVLDPFVGVGSTLKACAVDTGLKLTAHYG